MDYKINTEKKEKLFLIALEEFTENGYRNASTNRITEKAGVSKGLLFHYFGSKKELFLGCYKQTFNFFTDRFATEIKELPRDIIEKLLVISRWKIKMALEYPLQNKFLTRFMLHPPEAIKNEILEYKNTFSARFLPLILENNDYSLFREEYEPQKAMALIMLVVNSYGEQITNQFQNTENKESFDITYYYREIESYLNMLKKGLYK